MTKSEAREKMNKYTFEKANGNGLSKCQKCGIIGWDSFMYKVKEFNDCRVCDDCKIHMENGTENEIKNRWSGIAPIDYREVE